MRLIWVPGHSVISGNEITIVLTREGSTCQFLGIVPTLGNSRQNIRHMTKGWLFNQHMYLLHGLTSTQRQAQEMILGPSFAVKTRLLSLNRMQSRVIKGHDITPYKTSLLNTLQSGHADMCDCDPMHR